MFLNSNKSNYFLGYWSTTKKGHQSSVEMVDGDWSETVYSLDDENDGR